MNLPKILIAAAGLMCAACSSWQLPAPADFTASQVLPVTGASGFKQKSMTVGEYQVSIDRGSTRERTAGTGAVNDARKRQSYSFVITRNAETVATGGCDLAASELSVGAPAGISVVAKENASLECEMLPQGKGRDSWRLELKGKPDDPLNGTFIVGNDTYVLQGIGTAIGSTKHGPTGGYHIQRDGRTIATVQTMGDRQVRFAADAQNDALIAASVVLLLMDESVRDLDD